MFPNVQSFSNVIDQHMICWRGTKMSPRFSSSLFPPSLSIQVVCKTYILCTLFDGKKGPNYSARVHSLFQISTYYFMFRRFVFLLVYPRVFLPLFLKLSNFIDYSNSPPSKLSTNSQIFCIYSDCFKSKFRKVK